MTSHACAAVVVAAGAASRFGGGKQHAELAGRALWEWARDSLVAAGADPVVVVGPVPGGIPGGARRRDSVAAGLAALPSGAALVAVHDAARPLASAELARRLIDHMATSDVDGVIPAIRVVDTIKRVDEHGRVAETLDRSDLMAVQTPQVFRLASLVAAHAASDDDASDDALLVERWGGVVDVMEGEPTNLKVTYPSDLDIARALWEARS